MDCIHPDFRCQNGEGGPGQSRLILCLKDKAYDEDGVPCVVPAEAGTQRRKFLRDIRLLDERRAWIPACAGITRVSNRPAFLTSSDTRSTNGNGFALGEHSRRDGPDRLLLSVLKVVLQHIQHPPSIIRRVKTSMASLH